MIDGWKNVSILVCCFLGGCIKNCKLALAVALAFACALPFGDTFGAARWACAIFKKTRFRPQLDSQAIRSRWLACRAKQESKRGRKRRETLNLKPTSPKTASPEPRVMRDRHRPHNRRRSRSVRYGLLGALLPQSSKLQG